jgi:UPF0755 protein
VTPRRLLAAAAVLALVLGGAGVLLVAAPAPGGGLVVVREGDSVATIATRLRAAGIVRSALLFRVRARLRGLDRRIRPGEYRFADEPSLGQVLEVLAAGGDRPEVTIPEGLTVHEVAALLARQDLGTAASFLCLADDPEFLLAAGVPGPQLEGYLFPDTYPLSPMMGPGEILGMMVRRFHERFDGERWRRAAARGLTVNEVVTLASIVEKETGLGSERPLIAGVFYNRLRLGMPLQSDPTVIYAAPNFAGDLTRADLTRPSPYNTYVITGLPPGPIANPGIAALDAVLAPTDTPYLYFVSRNDGSHAFSATLAEHNRAVQQYQRGGTPHRPW